MMASGLSNKELPRNRNVLEEIANYLYVGLVPNSVTILCASKEVPRAIELIGDGQYIAAMVEMSPALINAGIGLIKYKEYRRVKSALENHGWDERLVKPKMYSWCQRLLTRQASKQLGYVEKFDEFAKKEGHKWYHFLPKPYSLYKTRNSVIQTDTIAKCHQ